MHGVIVSVEIDSSRAEEAVQLLNGMVVPRVKASPGFVSATWMRATDGSAGRGVLLFDSEDNAKAAAKMAAEGPPPEAPVTFRSAEIFEVLAQA